VEFFYGVVTLPKIVGMPPAKYQEFVVSEPFKAKKKHQNEEVFISYCSITCPYCAQKFVEIPEELLYSKKSCRILEHIRQCPNYQKAVKPAPEKKTIDMQVLLQRAQEAEEKLRLLEKKSAKRLKKALQAIWNEQGDGQRPPIRDQADLNDRLSRKRHAERGHNAPIAEALKRICKSKRQAKRLRSVLHPDGNSANSADLDMVRNALGL